MQAKLRETGRVEFVERERLDDILKELELSSSDLAREDIALRLGQLLSARLVAILSVSELSGEKDVGLRIFETETSRERIAISECGQGTVHELVDLVTEKAVPMLMREYPARALGLLDSTAEELGIELVPNLRLRNATDGVFPLAAGYPCASVCSCNELKNPSNYHWPTDTADNVDYATLADGIRLAEAVIRRLDERWL